MADGLPDALRSDFRQTGNHGAHAQGKPVSPGQSVIGQSGESRNRRPNREGAKSCSAHESDEASPQIKEFIIHLSSIKATN